MISRLFRHLIPVRDRRFASLAMAGFGLTAGIALAGLEDEVTFHFDGTERSLRIVAEETVELTTDARHLLPLEVGYLAASPWYRDSVVATLERANRVLNACDIGFPTARLQAVEASADYLQMDTRKLSELTVLFDDYDASRVTVLFTSPMETDALGFHPWHGAAYSEAVVEAHGGAAFQKNKLFISSAARYEPVTLPHELTHILCDHPSCGPRGDPGHDECQRQVHSPDPGSYMHRSARHVAIRPAECRQLVRCGLDNGFLNATPAR